MKVIKFCLFFSIICQCIFAQEGLQEDIMLHPADAFTAYTLKKNEFVYNQSPFTLPLPSWAWWGITDRLTAEIDLLPLLGGVFVEPYLPVPSFNFRYRLREQNGWQPALAIETMYQYLWRLQNQSDQDNIKIERGSGSSFYLHLNGSWQLNPKFHFHASVGFTYTEDVSFYGLAKSVTLNHTFNPDVSLSLDYRPKPWGSVHFTSSYGTTFVYLDNIPRKYQVSYGFRVAPFWKNKYSFLRNFRMELIAFYMYFPDVNESLESLAPVFPYFYWQFDF